MCEGVPEPERERILNRIPLVRIGRPQGVARAVRFVTEDGDYITGETLSINGGVYVD